MKLISIAFNLLTTLPLHPPADWRAGDSGRAAGWYSFVGLILGGLIAISHVLISAFLPPLVTGALTLTFWVALTGGLHLDGLADCCDGLCHTSNAEKRLEIMKDSRMGAFGGIGLFLILILKFSALASISSGMAVSAILLATSLGRWFILMTGFLPLARSGGMAADFAMGLKKSSLIWCGLIPLALTIFIGFRGLLALGLTFLAVVIIQRFALIRIGGVTGDVFGLIVEISETLILITLTA